MKQSRKKLPVVLQMLDLNGCLPHILKMLADQRIGLLLCFLYFLHWIGMLVYIIGGSVLALSLLLHMEFCES